jgi:hypothetical protein
VPSQRTGISLAITYEHNYIRHVRSLFSSGYIDWTKFYCMSWIPNTKLKQFQDP